MLSISGLEMKIILACETIAINEGKAALGKALLRPFGLSSSVNLPAHTLSHLNQDLPDTLLLFLA